MRRNSTPPLSGTRSPASLMPMPMKLLPRTAPGARASCEAFRFTEILDRLRGAAASGSTSSPARVRFQNIKQISLRKSSRRKIVTIFFTKSFRFEKGEPHADQARDLRRFDGRPGFADGAGAGQTFRCPEDQRTSDFIALQRPTADGRRNMDAASVSGTGFPRTNTAPIRDAKFGSTNALRTGGLHRAGLPREL